MTKNIEIIKIPDFESLEEVLKYCEELFANKDAKLEFISWKQFKQKHNKIPINLVKKISIEILKKP